jgi:hypothetical protein
MQSVRSATPALPTDLAGLLRLLAYTQALGLERFLSRPTRGIPSLVLALVWLVLAWRGTGRPQHVTEVQEPRLAALLGRERVPSATTLYRSLHRFSAQTVRAAVEAAYRAELPRRTERVWVSLDSPQLPYWGGAVGSASASSRAGPATTGAACAAIAGTWRSTRPPGRSSPSC